MDMSWPAVTTKKHTTNEYPHNHQEELTRIRWFVMSAYKNEKKAEEALKGKNGLEYFIPKHYAVRVYHGMKSKRLVPVIPNLVFVHASRKQITDFKKNHNFLQFVMWEKSTGQEYIVVPDEQMDSFIKIASQYEETTVYYKPEEIDVRKGTRVCIHGGKLDGVKGMFMRVKETQPPGGRDAWGDYGDIGWGSSRFDWSHFLIWKSLESSFTVLRK